MERNKSKQAKITFRTANIKDLPTLKHWDQQAHVIEADPNDDWNWELELLRQPEWRAQLIAEIDGQPIGFVQIIDPAEEETHYWGKNIGSNKRAIDIWIGEAINLGKGYGTQMMRMALERCFADEAVNEVWIDPLPSNKKALRFYEKIGFQFKEKRVLGGEECLVYAMRREDWSNKKINIYENE